jgi:hypothetical protein
LKSEPGSTMTLGSAAAAHVRLIVWCQGCRLQIEPDPAEQAERYGANTAVLEWRDRLVCSKLLEPRDRHGGDGKKALASARSAFPMILSFRITKILPLQIRNSVRPATGEWDYVIFPEPRAGAFGSAGRRAGMLPLELPGNLSGPVFPRRDGISGERNNDREDERQ